MISPCTYGDDELTLGAEAALPTRPQPEAAQVVQEVHPQPEAVRAVQEAETVVRS